MDCEKFEPLLLDELYEELDEVTSAAVKRHVSGCARCASILNGMRSTRRAVALPMLELPDGLEDRILSSVKEAEKVVPFDAARRAASAQAADADPSSRHGRASRALSWAGSWAMRPQTAMAAVFLLMIGTSAFVIRSRHASSSDGAAAVSVTEQGMPAGQSAPAGGDDHESLDSKAAAAAHGADQPAPVTAPPPSPEGRVATSPVASAAGAVAFGDPSSAGTLDGITAGKGRVAGNAKDDNSGMLGSALMESTSDDKVEKNKEEQAPRREAKKSAPPSAATPAPPSDITNAGVPGGAPRAGYAGADRDYAPRSQSVSPPMPKALQQDQQDGFSSGMAAYRSRNFVEATRQFDGAARTGDQNAALWAAKSVKDGNGGCSAAIPRFDAVAQKSSGTYIGSEAQLEAASCQIAIGQLDAARDRLAKLTNVPSHAARAQQALNELNQVASRREAERAKSAGAGRPAAAAPARAPAKPAATAGAKPADDASNKAGF